MKSSPTLAAFALIVGMTGASILTGCADSQDPIATQSTPPEPDKITTTIKLTKDIEDMEGGARLSASFEAVADEIRMNTQNNSVTFIDAKTGNKIVVKDYVNLDLVSAGNKYSAFHFKLDPNTETWFEIVEPQEP